MALSPRAQMRVVLADVARERDIDPAMIEGNNRAPIIADARAEIAKRLSACGLTEKLIAQVMHMSAFSVQVYLGTRDRHRKATHPES